MKAGKIIEALKKVHEDTDVYLVSISDDNEILRPIRVVLDNDGDVVIHYETAENPQYQEVLS